MVSTHVGDFQYRKWYGFLSQANLKAFWMTIQKKLSKIHVSTCFRRYFVNSFDAFLNLYSSFWRRVVQDGSQHRIFSPD